MQTAVLIVAAGRGTRAGVGIPKQWRNLNGQSVLSHTLAAFRNVKGLGPFALVIHPDDEDRLHGLDLTDVILTTGGANRNDSVRAGLEALAKEAPDAVLIHDAARPLVSAAVIGRVVDALAVHEGAAPAVEVTDALWRGDANLVAGTQDRTGLWRAQTPQGFRYHAILSAHRTHRGEAADDVAVARESGIAVAIVAGDEDNLKITREGDFDRAAQLMRMKTMGGLPDVRTGNGFDVHAFGPGDHVWLCGVKIAHSHGLIGHSDADVGMHAVTDAIYGALSRGDIGQHFPPSDPQWKGAASHIFLRHACDLAGSMGFTITHADCTLICEYPKIGPHAAAMRAEMARIMGLDPDRVSAKATTSERLGFTGRSEGIAALASATLVRLT
ncbi:MAG: bifunctional 2-C-methyl-D-erythritol 4-phosphate cytidylyltransferase/2-C-methyl-D-erythritol 2,4-cyclodiphosphate synthase [Rhodobacterales bacterium]|nr:bifunctional 2-C-methyl-D-erythritol 4-phosphate cytidylyltransferase/2-C-methyl-D-erythritol 2,4-cyclodiphosphate synthase [Rhodobacterales bacterium]